jgi:hypothetical protein
MAINFDAQNQTTFSSVSSKNISITVGSGSDRVAILNIWTGSTISSVSTLGGATATLELSSSGGGFNFFQYSFKGMSTGSQTTTVTLNSTDNLELFLTTYDGVDQITPTTGAVATGATYTAATFTAASGAAANWWHIWGFHTSGSTSSRTWTATTNTTLRWTSGGQPDGTYIDTFVADSNGIDTSPSQTYTVTSSVSDGGGWSRIILIAASAAPTSHIKSADGILYANIKSMSGVAIANVKSTDSVTN